MISGLPGSPAWRLRFNSCNPLQPHSSIAVRSIAEIGTDSKTIQDMLRWADPSILLKVYAHSRMDKRMEAQAKMIEAMGLNEKTARGLIQ